MLHSMRRANRSWCGGNDCRGDCESYKPVRFQPASFLESVCIEESASQEKNRDIVK